MVKRRKNKFESKRSNLGFINMKDKCPTCKNEEVKKFYVIGDTPENGEKFCDKCVNDDKYRKKVIGVKKNV